MASSIVPGASTIISPPTPILPLQPDELGQVAGPAQPWPPAPILLRRSGRVKAPVKYVFTQPRRTQQRIRPRQLHLGPTEFSWFKKLPAEVRAIIWKWALDMYGGNVITVGDAEVMGPDPTTGQRVVVENRGAWYRIPGMLSANMESRYYAKQVYAARYGTRMPPVYEERPIRFGPLDILYLRDEDAFHRFFHAPYEDDLALIQDNLPTDPHFRTVAFAVGFDITEFTELIDRLALMGRPLQIHVIHRDGGPVLNERGMQRRLDWQWTNQNTTAARIRMQYPTAPTLHFWDFPAFKAAFADLFQLPRDD